MTEDIPPDIISKIRKGVRNGKTKRQVADELNISYYTVKKHTKDIITEKRISIELERKIRQDVMKSKSKRQVAEELNV